MKKIFILLFILLLGINAYALDVPYKEVALRIYNIPYDKHTANCLWKSEMYFNYIISKVINAKVVVGRYGNEKFYRHAWVQYKQDNKCYIIDLTDNPRTWGYESKYYWWLKKGE